MTLACQIKTTSSYAVIKHKAKRSKRGIFHAAGELCRTNLDIVFSLHVLEECPDIIQHLFGVFALKIKIGRLIRKSFFVKKCKRAETETTEHLQTKENTIFGLRALPQ